MLHLNICQNDKESKSSKTKKQQTKRTLVKAQNELKGNKVSVKMTKKVDKTRKRPSSSKAEQPLPKQTKLARKKNSSAEQEDANNNAMLTSMEESEPIVGTAKSLINLIKKHKGIERKSTGEVQQGHPKPKLVGSKVNVPREKLNLNEKKHAQPNSAAKEISPPTEQVEAGETAYERLYRKVKDQQDKQQRNIECLRDGNKGMSGHDRIFVTVHASDEDELFNDMDDTHNEMHDYVNRSMEEEVQSSQSSSESSNESDIEEMNDFPPDGEGIEESHTVRQKLNYDKLKDQLDEGDIESLKQDPRIQEFLKQMLNEQEPRKTPSKGKGKDKLNERWSVPKEGTANRLKSPSDTTIYAPALYKEITPIKFDRLQNNSSEMDMPLPLVPAEQNKQNQGDCLTNQIVQFLDNMCVVSATERQCSDKKSEGEWPGTSYSGGQKEPDHGQWNKDAGRMMADQRVVEAEQFKASLEKPTGESFPEHLFKALTDYLK